MRRLAGKTAIVTGASRGIGAAIAHRLHEEGASLVLVSRQIDELEHVVGELGERVLCLAASVDQPHTAELAIDLAADLGGVDVLVNNAGLDLVRKLTETSESDARAIFETNVFGALWMMRGVALELERTSRPGSIVNITSRLASIGVPSMSVYGASKGAVLALTRGAAVELAPRGIRVNAVAPGMTATAMFGEYMSLLDDGEDAERQIAAAIPQGRLASPDDVAAAVAFLAADESAHITGASIAVDGGYTAA